MVTDIVDIKTIGNVAICSLARSDLLYHSVESSIGQDRLREPQQKN